MIAIARRVFGVFAILVALVFLCWPGAGVWRLSIVDYGAEYQDRMEYVNKAAAKRTSESGEPLVVRKATPQGLEQYVKKKTRMSLRQVEGPAWEELYQKTSQSGRYLHLPADTPPLDTFYQAGGRNVFDILLPGKYPVFLKAVMDSISSSYHGPEVTWGMTRPLARLSPWFALVGILVYIFLPWPKKKPDHFRYHRVRSQIGIDLLGIFIAGAFLVLPLFIVIQFAGDPHPLSLDRGKAVVTLICWFVALVAAANFIISTWYEKLHFQITRTGIRKANLFGTKDYSFDQMVEMKKTVWRPPGWFRKLSWLMIMFSLGIAAPMILGSQTAAPMVKVRCRDGGTLSIMVKHLVGWENLERALLNSGLDYAVEESKA